jgi:hypothetical protein
MSQTTTPRLGLIKNTPGTNEQVNIGEINSGFDAIDASFIPACKIRSTIVQTLTSSASPTAVNFDTTSYDTTVATPLGAMADLANERMICRFDGLYTIVLSLIYAANATGARVGNIVINGTTVKRFSMSPSSGNNTSILVTDDIPLVAGDLISASCLQTSGGNLDLLNQASSGDPDGVMLLARWNGKHP